MTPPAIEATIEAYRSGLEAEIGLLHRLEALAARQQAAAAARSIEPLTQIADERDRLTIALVAIENDLRHLRQDLAAVRDQASELPTYQAAAAAHREAIALVTRIIGMDQAALASLNAAELLRRDTARALEQGETTLSAYRKVAAIASGSTLVDRRG